MRVEGQGLCILVSVLANEFGHVDSGKWTGSYGKTR